MIPAASATSRTRTSLFAGQRDLSMAALTASTGRPPASIMPLWGQDKSVVSLNLGLPALTDSSTTEYGHVRSGQQGSQLGVMRWGRMGRSGRIKSGWVGLWRPGIEAH